MSNEVNNENLALPEDILKKLSAVDEIMKERADQDKVTKIEQEYLQDEKKKLLWESGFGEKLKKNVSKVNDTDWVAGQLELASERLAIKLEKMQSEAKTKQEEPEKPPMQPGNIPPSDSKNEEFNTASPDIFNNEEFIKKLDAGHQLMLKINKPKATPSWK